MQPFTTVKIPEKKSTMAEGGGGGREREREREREGVGST